MTDASNNKDIGESRIVLGLLETVERDGRVSQRRLASELDIALGLANIYIKRCIKKGLVKMAEAPARRYAYYLTPQGFVEKSRLTVQYLTSSFSFFRYARADCAAALQTANVRGWSRIALVGASELAEVSIICGLEIGVEIVTIVDPGSTVERFVGRPVVKSFADIDGPCDAALLTDLTNPQDMLAKATQHFGADRVLVPSLLSGRIDQSRGVRR